MATITVSSGTNVSGIVVSSGDTLEVYGIAQNTTVLSGGTVVNSGTMYSARMGDTAVTVSSGGSVINDGSITGYVPLYVDGGTIDNFGSITGGEDGRPAIQLGTGTDLVVIEGGSTESSIGYFAPGDQIILRDLPWSTSNTVDWSGNTSESKDNVIASTLTVSGGGKTDTLHLQSVSDLATFAVTSAPGGGTLVTETIAGTPPLAIGGSATGSIDTVGDMHAYQVSLANGTRYAFTLEGSDISSNYTLRDPYLKLVDSFGRLVAANDDISSSNWSSQIVYTPNSSGTLTYYLEASSSPSDSTYTTGSYRIQAAQDDYRDSYKDTTQPLGTVPVNGTATGAINYLGDKDVFSVTLTAGTRYAFNLDGYDISSTYSLRDPYLQLLDSNGKVLATSDDVSSRNWSSEIDYTAATGATYYLVAASSPSDSTYTTGNYQIRSSTPTALAIGKTATGEISYVGGKDTYQVSLAPGTHYVFNLDGYDVSSSYSLRDPYLQLLSGTGKVLATSDDISASNWSSKIDYTTIGGGTYYLVAASSPSDGTYTIGNYQIRSSVTSAPSAALAPAIDQSNQSGNTIVSVASGDQTLTAGSMAETFDFSSLSFGKDTIVGFDPARDALRLGSSLAGDFAAVSADMSATAGGTLIALDPTHSITLSGVAPATLSAANFQFV